MAQATSHPVRINMRLVGDLKLDPGNARIHKPRQINLLAKSIESFGFNAPILVDAESNVIAGHARILACQKLGIAEVPTIRLEHLSADQVRAFKIADNRLAEIASWDDKRLGEQLQALSIVDLDFDIEATGFTVGEIDLRIEGLGDVEETDLADGDVVIPAGPAVTQLGDVWQLGSHRIACGNALEVEAYHTLMSGRRAAVVFTDPPYNVKIFGHAGGNGAIKHREFGMASGEMSPQQFTAFLNTAFSCMTKYSQQGAIHFICMDWRHLPEILMAGKDIYAELKNLCVWVKDQAGMGSLYRSRHELILVYKFGEGSHQNNVQLGRFGRYRSNIWEYPGIQAMRHGEEGDLLALHPTVKPIRLVADAILDCSCRGDIVLDAFLGSGTTLLAAERTGRICHGLELDPLYVDTAILRWQNLTGEDAVHVATGETFTQRQLSLDQLAAPVPDHDADIAQDGGVHHGRS